MEMLQRAAPLVAATLLFALGVFLALSPHTWCPILPLRLVAALSALVGGGSAALLVAQPAKAEEPAVPRPRPSPDRTSSVRLPQAGTAHITSQDLLKTAADQKKAIEELRATVQTLEKQLAGMRLQAGIEEDGRTIYLWSQEYFRRVLESELWRSRRRQRPLSLLVIDFTDENAVARGGGRSHATAPVDSSLWQDHAQTVCRAVRGGDQVGLVADGPLCVLLPETSPDEAKVAQERVTKLLQQELTRGKSRQASIAVDTAVVGFPRDGKDLNELILAAKKTILRAQRDRRTV